MVREQRLKRKTQSIGSNAATGEIRKGLKSICEILGEEMRAIAEQWWWTKSR